MTLARMLILLSFALLTSVARNADAADAQEGARLAERWCASCHAISPNQAQATTQAPPFSEIAKTQGFDAAKVAYFLLAPHPRMPDMNLSRSEAADLAVYIETQRKS
jgi:mono/diheme cytochrome c family protein